MRSLVGHAVTVYLTEETPPLRLEGRIEEERDGLLEIRLARRELSSLKDVLRRTLRAEVEYAEGRDVWGMSCRLERYATAFPPVVVLRPAGGPRLLHRRRHARYATNLPVRLIIPSPRGEAEDTRNEERWYEGRMVNLSQGGAGVVLPRALADSDPPLFTPGQDVVLQFVASKLVKPRAKVVRREEGPDVLVLGLEFHSLTSHDTFSLDSYLTGLARLETAASR
ncbi:MAG: PilZ domain-containing protein [Bacillota bacterium]|nr:PilZ domain-containing protein [Bacillota bacterium]